MKDGTRYIIFSHLVKNVPSGSSERCGTYAIGEELQAMLIKNYRAEVEQIFMNSFGKYLSKGGYNDAEGNFVWSRYVKAQNIEEAVEHATYFKTVEDALKWAAESLYMSEMQEGIDWLVSEGYIREHKEPARFGYRHYLSVTQKGWKIAHLYK